jgi:hypothetical protein
MKLRPAIVAALVSLTLAYSLSAQSNPTYTVGTVKEFLQRLGPNRTIILKKGDYKLWTGWQESGANFGWLAADDGSKELTIDKADNLTIRGADGARIITNSAQSYLMGFYGGSAIEIDNLILARQLENGAISEVGTLYVESVDKLSISRTSITGSSGYPLEVWDCANVAIKDIKIDGSSGGFSIGKVSSFSAKGGSVSHADGYPLIYVEDSASVNFEGMGFADSTGGNFIEIYPGEDDKEISVVFSKCSFLRDNFEYFSASGILPETLDCNFQDSSFDETWPENSVNTVSDESYSNYSEPEMSDYTDPDSGLVFTYPAAWDFEESGAKGRVAVFAPDSDALVFFSQASQIKTKFDQAREGERLFASALSNFQKLLKSDGSMAYEGKPSGAAYAWGSHLQKEYTGPVTRKDGTKADARLRLTLLPAGVYAFIAVASDEGLLDDGGDLETILSSLYLPEGE